MRRIFLVAVQGVLLVFFLLNIMLLTSFGVALVLNRYFLGECVSLEVDYLVFESYFSNPLFYIYVT